MKRDGFTLIELVVSFALLGLISVSMLSVFSTGLGNIFRAGVRTETVNIAEYDMIYLGEVTTTETVSISLPTTSKDSSDNDVSVEINEIKGSHISDSLRGEVEVDIFYFSPVYGGN